MPPCRVTMLTEREVVHRLIRATKDMETTTAAALMRPTEMG